jgi:hypothetical protein
MNPAIFGFVGFHECLDGSFTGVTSGQDSVSGQKHHIKTRMKKKLVLLSLALLAVIAILYTGLNGLTNDHPYGFFFTFVGGLTTIGLGMDVVNHVRTHLRKTALRKLGPF